MLCNYHVFQKATKMASMLYCVDNFDREIPRASANYILTQVDNKILSGSNAIPLISCAEHGFGQTFEPLV